MSEKIFIADRDIAFYEKDSFFNTLEAYIIIDIIKNNLFIDKFKDDYTSAMFRVNKEILISYKDFIKKRYIDKIKSRQNNEITYFNMANFERFFNLIKSKEDEYVILKLIK